MFQIQKSNEDYIEEPQEKLIALYNKKHFRINYNKKNKKHFIKYILSGSKVDRYYMFT